MDPSRRSVGREDATDDDRPLWADVSPTRIILGVMACLLIAEATLDGSILEGFASSSHMPATSAVGAAEFEAIGEEATEVGAETEMDADAAAERVVPPAEGGVDAEPAGAATGFEERGDGSLSAGSLDHGDDALGGGAIGDDGEAEGDGRAGVGGGSFARAHRDAEGTNPRDAAGADPTSRWKPHAASALVGGNNYHFKAAMAPKLKPKDMIEGEGDGIPTAKKVSEASIKAALHYCQFSPVLKDKAGRAIVPRTYGGYSPDVVMGIGTGSSYTYDKIVPFVKSLRVAGFKGAIILGVSALKGKDEEKREAMFDAFNVTGIDMGNTKGGSWGQAVCRYAAFMEFTKTFVPEGGMVLSSDVRDVYFQGHPFEDPVLGARRWLGTKASLLLFQEGLNDIKSQRVTFSQKNNKRWVETIYGAAELRKFYTMDVHCSGTTMGTRRGFVAYTRAMLGEAMNCLKKHPNKKDRGVHVCQGGADQGEHNTLYYKGKLAGALSLPNAAGPVYTIGLFGNKPIRNVMFDRDDEGYVVSPKERTRVPVTRVPVVHQYDRHPALNEFVYETFALAAEGVNKKKWIGNMGHGGSSGVGR